MNTLVHDGSSEKLPFHAGELAIQQQAGTLAEAAWLGQRMIRDHMPEQHRLFFHQLPFLMVGSVDDSGQPWASMMVGAPGFIHSPDAQTVRINAQPLPGDKLAENMRDGARLGMLGIELPTRRRNRLNATVEHIDDDGFTARVEQSFGNCPQYIQTREPQLVKLSGPVQVHEYAVLTPADRALIESADTMFIASNAAASADTANASAAGADISHRGGQSGFIRVEDGRTLLLPDFAGNRLYQTLGNLHLDPRAGLLFIDFDTGDYLQVSCTASLVWDGPQVAAFAGAQRLLRLKVVGVRRLANSLPLRWSARSYWPQIESTGTWQQADRAIGLERKANEWRAYRISGTRDESASIRTFFLDAVDGLAVPSYTPGQFLPIRLPAAAGGLQRIYTLSAAPDGQRLQISVKRQGAASSWLHEQSTGAVIEAKSPGGAFTFDRSRNRSAVMLSAGAGITPMIAMLDGLLPNDGSQVHQLPIYFVHGARNAQEQAFAEELANKRASHRNLFVHLVHSQDGDAWSEAVQARPYRGRVSIDLLKKILPFDDYDFYLCGPQGFMQELYDGLRGLNVRDARIHFEDFGGDSPMRRMADTDAPAAKVELVDLASASPAAVKFHVSSKEITWQPEDGTLLELAEANGMTPLSGCRSGNCGTCASRVLSGRSGYVSPPGAQCAPEHILTCISIPLPSAAGEPLVLDL
ncbi:pyridoxamine 5'-phosphate oxidase family protein [Janthinobacterium aquaticum]|uniref:pyridoxamine 5'-phosphate oxidase family protein n=1 Tax=Janthinobacterium sp. FT58W TaxID=2654254 RepID=UPI001264F701|nr:pyridoxamine 5'-phosphate oxidase family protein [Janthinobacterium sp. FT58W]KAB8045191.1 2Fe-2S iron-sulfur cluster binding domain-containing protein [Janthinobacterium sp. FT58W]